MVVAVVAVVVAVAVAVAKFSSSGVAEMNMFFLLMSSSSIFM